MKDEINQLKSGYEDIVSNMLKEIDILKENQKQQERMQKQNEENLLKRIEKLEENQKQQEKIQKQNEENLLKKIEKLEENQKQQEKVQKEKEELIQKIKEEEQKSIVKLNYIKGKEFKGINDYLNNLKGGNIHDIGTINITTNSCHSDRYHPKCLIEYDKDNYYHSKNDFNNIEIFFDYKDHKIQLTNYTIKSYQCSPNSHHLKNWVIELSNDKQNWKKADERNNNPALNDKFAIATFETDNLNEFFRYVRLRQTGQNWMNHNYMVFNALEFYGKLKLPK